MEPFRKGQSLPALEPRRDHYDAPRIGARITYRELTRVEYVAAVTILPDHTYVGEDGQRYLTDLGVVVRTANLVAAGCIDPETGEQLWDGQAVLGWPKQVWDDAVELEARILTLSEVGAEALKKSRPPVDAGGTARPRRRRHEQPSAGTSTGASSTNK